MIKSLRSTVAFLAGIPIVSEALCVLCCTVVAVLGYWVFCGITCIAEVMRDTRNSAIWMGDFESKMKPLVVGETIPMLDETAARFGSHSLKQEQEQPSIPMSNGINQSPVTMR